MALRASAGVACLLAAVLLLSTPTQPGGRSRAQADLRQVTRRLRPLLVVVAVTGTVEFGGLLLLLLHRQRGFGLTVGQIALVFLPGFVILTALPLRLYAVVRRIGRAATLTSSLVASAIVAVGLAFAALGHSGPSTVRQILGARNMMARISSSLLRSRICALPRGGIGRCIEACGGGHRYGCSRCRVEW